MISRITIESRSTVTYFPSTLSDLDKHMIRCNGNLMLFNDFVKAQLAELKARGEKSKNIMVNLFTALKARGEKSNEIMVNLFKGYKVILDRQFKLYIAQKINEYDERGSISEDILMTLAENKSKTILRAVEWKSPNEDQKEVRALSAGRGDDEEENFQSQCKDGMEEKSPSDPKAIKQYENTHGAQNMGCGLFTNQKSAIYQKQKGTMPNKTKTAKTKWKLANSLDTMQTDDSSTVKQLVADWVQDI